MGYRQSDFKDFTSDQLASNEHFRRWVLYAEPGKDAFWEIYLVMYPHQEQTVLKAREKVEAGSAVHQNQPLTTDEKLAIKYAIFQKINQPVKSFNPLRHKGKQWLQAAAVVTVMLMGTAYLLNKKPIATTTDAIAVVQRTGAKEVKEIMLADSSVVILNANSSITYQSDIDHNQSRELRLEGNAFFKIKKKADGRSFTVHTNSMSVAVLGTEFNVDARSTASTVVLVSGKVKVNTNQNIAAAMYMSPGEKVQLDTLQHTLTKSVANTQLYSAWTDGKWNFSSTSMLDISKLIYQYYGVETVFANEKIRQLKISAVIPVTDLAAFTNIIAKTLNLKITEHNNQLLIKF